MYILHYVHFTTALVHICATAYLFSIPVYLCIGNIMGVANNELPRGSFNWDYEGDQKFARDLAENTMIEYQHEMH